MEIKDKIVAIISKATGVKNIYLDKPKQGFGDYSFTCFDIASKQKRSPQEIALEIVDKIKKKLPKEIEKVEAVNGYINFTIKKEALFKTIVEKILLEKEKYGSLKVRSRTLIEHTSINPNAPPHIGRIRNAIIGDIISRLLRFHGYKTEVHYYVNDISKQMALLLLGATGKETFNELLDLYRRMTEYLKEHPEFEQEVFKVLEKLEKGDKETINKLNKLVQIAINGQKSILGRLGIYYDFFDYESSYVNSTILNDILKRFEKTGRLQKDVEGRYVLDQSGTKWNFEKEMKSPVLVLTRSNGTGLYVLRDIVYTINKLKIAPLNLVVLGEDQKLYFKQLSAALELLGYNAPRVIHYSYVLISNKGQKKKMSTRAGRIILISRFIEEAVKKALQEIRKRKRTFKLNEKAVAEAIGVGAIRYSIAKVELNKGILFDWQEALNFEGNSAPYLQYSYVRAHHILKKSFDSKKEMKEKKDKDKSTSKEKINLSSYLKMIGDLDFTATDSINDKEYNLLKVLELFPEVCANALQHLKPNLLCNYAYTLAKTFNDFYESCPVIQAEKQIKERRILLTLATKQVLENVLHLIGVPIFEAM